MEFLSGDRYQRHFGMSLSEEAAPTLLSAGPFRSGLLECHILLNAFALAELERAGL